VRYHQCVAKNNPEHRADYDRAYCERNRERIKEYQRQYREKNREKLAEGAKARSRAHYLANREEILERQRRRRAEKRDEVAAYAREYAAKNRDKVYARQRTWREANRDSERERLGRRRAEHPIESRTRTQRHRSRKRGAVAHHTDEEMTARAALFGNACAYCGGPWEHDDHSIPLAREPDDSAPNMVPACERCNKMKGARDAKTFIALRLARGEPLADHAVRFLNSSDRYWTPDPTAATLLRVD
jgi:5-methylcytosine-specific restriction endonuclease McrA